VEAVDAGRRRAGQRLLLAAAVLGLLFVGLKSLEYWLDVRKGLRPGTATMGDGGDSLFFLLYYVMTGVHALHLLVGIAVLLVFSVGLARGTGALCQASHLRVAGLYWHFVDAVWVLLYPVLYLVGRSA
jgi:cytochrome c oxidase subunit 3